MSMKSLQIAILYDDISDSPNRFDGTSSNFELMPPSAVTNIIYALDTIGIKNTSVISTSELFALKSNKHSIDIDFVFNLSAGLSDNWRFAQGPFILDMLNVPYSGSDPFTTLITRDKNRSKKLVEHATRVPIGVVVDESSLSKIDDVKSTVFPCIVKPNQEGGSSGVGDGSVVETKEEAKKLATTLLADYPEGILIEQFISGTEITVVAIGNKASGRNLYALALANSDEKMLPHTFYRTQIEKGNAFQTGDRCWFPLSELISKEMEQDVNNLTNMVCDELGLRDLSRIDFRLDSNFNHYFIEANAHPTFADGLTSFNMANKYFYTYPHGVEIDFVSCSLSRAGLLNVSEC